MTVKNVQSQLSSIGLKRPPLSDCFPKRMMKRDSG